MVAARALPTCAARAGGVCAAAGGAGGAGRAWIPASTKERTPACRRLVFAVQCKGAASSQVHGGPSHCDTGNFVKHVQQYLPSYSTRYMMKKSSNSYGDFCNRAGNSLLYWVGNKIPLLDPLNPVLLAAVNLHFKIVWWNFTTVVYEIRVLRCINHRLKLPHTRSFQQSCYGFLSSITINDSLMPS